VIVKMASIELTPEKPEFSAGSWHVSFFLPSNSRYLSRVPAGWHSTMIHGSPYPFGYSPLLYPQSDPEYINFAD
jgi:hypothetical protein